MKLHNKINGEVLKKAIQESTEKRLTISFYKYAFIGNPQVFRDHLYLMLEPLGVLGRIYVAKEGINAQISVPEANFDLFKIKLQEIVFLDGIRLNTAVEDDGKSFFVLRIKVRPKIVADGIDDPEFDSSKMGEHLPAEKFNEITQDPETILVDMRNHYESEVGRFKGAWCPDVDTFREQLPLVAEKLKDKKNKKVVMYCTGGIRCEKASAYMKFKGFQEVYQLEGGIIKYARDVKEKGLENRFVGKNFVFDERLEERITDDIIAQCHQCGNPFDYHGNCRNAGCNLLFIQCPTCASNLEGCCSIECMNISRLSEEEQKEIRRGKDGGMRIFSKGRFGKREVKGKPTLLN